MNQLGFPSTRWQTAVLPLDLWLKFLLLQYGNVWRTAGDITQSWPEIIRVLDSSVGLMQYSKPGAWADLDMLEVSILIPSQKWVDSATIHHFPLSQRLVCLCGDFCCRP